MPRITFVAMKILHVTNYGIGGAGIAAHRLHTAFREAGIDSRMLVRRGRSNDPFLTEIGDQASEGGGRDSEVGSRKSEDRDRRSVDSGESQYHATRQPINHWARLMVRVRGWLGAKLTKALGMEGGSLNIFPTGLHKVLNASDADVVHLHWINNEMISIKEIAKIKKPLVWTLHDCWPLLGAEHHSDAEYWKSSEFRGQTSENGDQQPEASHEKHKKSRNRTSSTNQPAASNWMVTAINNWIFHKKQKHWKDLDVHFVAPSNWMAEQVRQGTLFSGASVRVIPNGLDTNIFLPMDKAKSRQKFDLPQDRNLILFGAYSPLESNKGSDLLEKALLSLPEIIRGNTDLVVFGADGEDSIAGLKTHWMGSITTEEEMATLYNAADVVCVPSRKESFGQTASEALACGIPVVAFRTTGLIDVVDHEENGYLAEPFDAKDLSLGLKWVLGLRMKLGGQRAEFRVHNLENSIPDHSATDKQQSDSKTLSINARVKVQCCFSNSIVVRDYLSYISELR